MRLDCLKARHDGQRACATGTQHRPTRCHLRWLSVLFGLIGLLVLNACDAGELPSQSAFFMAAAPVGDVAVKPEELRMWMTVGQHRFAITLNDDPTARAFATQLPMTLNMAELNGNEKHAHLPKTLPMNPIRPGAIRNGDLMLYGSDTLVVFYSAFNSSYSYTPLGHVNDTTGLAQALGKRGVRVIFSID